MLIMIFKKIYIAYRETRTDGLNLESYTLYPKDSDGYMIRKCITLKSILFIMFENLKLVLRSYTSLYGIFMSASLTLFMLGLHYVPGSHGSHGSHKSSSPRCFSHFCFCVQVLLKLHSL